MRYKIMLFVGVGQNSEGQWYACDLTPIQSSFVTIDKDTTLKEVLVQLKSANVVDNTDARKFIATDLTAPLIEIKRKKDECPICRLTAMR